jgi:LuxR family maltose regulon positive regulatory protein
MVIPISKWTLMMMNTTIAEKTRIPSVREQLVTRNRLEAKLRQSLEARLTTVTAPAGFGKTTAVSGWIIRDNVRASWLSLKEGDDARFWHYAVYAVDRLFPGFADRLSPILDERDASVSPEFFVSHLIRELERQEEPFVLVLDDYHLVKSAAVHDSMQLFLTNMPATVHLVIIGQQAPPFPVARLRMLGQLNEIDMRDLRFTAEEASELVKQSANLNLPADEIELLCTKTEGWAVGIKIASIYLREHDDHARLIRDFSGSHRLVVDYVKEVLLDRQPESVRTFLLYTSILDRFCFPLCRAVAGIGVESQPDMDLDGLSFFIIPLDPERVWFRYHGLFAECLQQLLSRYASPEQVADAHRRACDWFAQHRMYKEAISHALAAGEGERVVHLIANLLEQSPQDARNLAFEPWFAEFPVHLLLKRPKVFVFLTGTLLLFGKTTLATRIVEEAERIVGSGWEPSPDDDGFSLHKGLSVLRAGIRMYLDFTRILDHIEEAVQLIQWSGRKIDFWNRDDVRLSRSYIGMGGKIKTSIGVYARIVSNPRYSIFFYENMEGYGHVMLAELYYESNDLHKAGIELAQAMPAVHASGKPAILVPAAYLKARLEYAKGRPDEAKAALQDAEERLRAMHSPRWMSILEAVNVSFRLREGAVEEGVRWAERRLLDGTGKPNVNDEFEHFIYARVLMASGKLEEAVHWLMQLFEQARSRHRYGSEIEALLLLALCWMRRGDAERAFQMIGEAVAMGEAERHVRAFLDEGTEMAELLSGWLKVCEMTAPPVVKKQHIKYACDLLAQFEREREKTAGDAAAIPPMAAALLTKRQYEILLRMASGASNEEIANELFLAVGTVKRHTHQIFQKFEARNRVEAISKASKLGIL